MVKSKRAESKEKPNQKNLEVSVESEVSEEGSRTVSWTQKL